MKNKQVKKEGASQTRVRSIFCYGNEDIKKMIWSLKTDRRFFDSENGKKLMERLWNEIQNNKGEGGVGGVASKTIIICAPSSSFWQSRKNFDHMHVSMKACVKNWRSVIKPAQVPVSTQMPTMWPTTAPILNTEVKYVPYSIIPKLNKSLQKGLNKKDRQKQSSGAYGLSNYFKHFLRYHFFNKNKRSAIPNWNILIIDDVKTTGSTLNECSHIVENYIEGLLDKYGFISQQQTKIIIKCLTIAYEA